MKEENSQIFCKDIEGLISQLRHIANSISHGKYSVRLDMNSENSGIIDLEQSLNQILELFELNTKITLIGENSLINDFLEVFSAYADREFSRKIEISEAGTILDAIGAGINMLGEELEESTVSKNELELERDRLNQSQQIANLGDWEYHIDTDELIYSETFAKVLEIGTESTNGLFDSLKDKIDFEDKDLNQVMQEAKEKAYSTFNCSFMDATGRTKFLNCIINHIYSSDKQLLGYKGVVLDITPLKESQNKLHYQIELQKLITEVSSSFINTAFDINKFVNNVLQRLTQFFDTDRSYFIWFSSKQSKQINHFEYNNDFVNYSTQELFDTNPSLVEVCKATASGNQVIQVYNIANVTQEAEREALLEKKVKSFLTIPVFSDSDGFALFGMDTVRERKVWTDEDVNGIRIIANIISDALQRNFFEQKLIEAKKQAEESDRLKTAFLMNMSHEIRTPMNGIMGFITLVEEPELEHAERQQYIEIIKESGKRLMDTINDIMEISRIEAGEVTLNKEDFDLCDLIKYLAGFFKTEALKKGLFLNRTDYLRPHECIIHSDKTKLTSILNNLIKNAIKFTNKGSIAIGATIEKQFVKVFVQDTGVGIPADRLSAIFDRFVQADLKLTRSHEGSGLGLAIAKAYTEALGGVISVQSTHGKGSRFEVSIPHNRQYEALHDSSDDKFNMTKILVAEDDMVSFEFLNTILTRNDYYVVHVADGKAALEAVENDKQLALVLMDIKMPIMDGLEAIKRIRERNKTLPIIVQTAHAFSGEKDKAFQLGCDDYITKPVHGPKLLAKIKKLIDKA
jgi:signal transduction histidine kinase/CheY-like chemotaxis protein